MTDVGKASIEVEGDVRSFARQTQRDLDRALSRIKSPSIDVKADVEVDRNRAAAQFLALGTEAAGQMTTAIGKGLGGLSSALTSNPYVAAAGLALAASIVAVAAPAIGALLSSALIAGGGLGVIGLGAWLLKEEPAIKNAATTLMDAVKKTFTDAAKPLIGPLVAALGTFAALIQQIAPEVQELFRIMADSGAIQALATGLAGLVASALPGFLALVKASGPFLTQMGQLLPVIGAALSEFFSSIAAGGPQAAVFFKDLVVFIAAMIISLGQFIGWLTRAYVSVRQFFTDAAAWITGAIAAIQAFGAAVVTALAPLIAIFSGVWRAISAATTTFWALIANSVKTAIAIVKGVIAAGSAAIRGDWQGTWNAIKSIASAALNSVRTVVSTVINGIRGVVSGAMSAVRATWSAGWNGMISVVSSAASRIRSAVSGLASTVRGAFASAGSWLVSAGRRIIDGLVSGISAGFGRVRSMLSSLTAMLPSWKGPAEVDSKILRESGRLVMGGFEAGLRDQFSSVRKTLGDLTGDLPAFAAGPVRGGDGASSGGPLSLAGATFNVNVSGATGEEAGRRAAEEILKQLGQAALVS